MGLNLRGVVSVDREAGPIADARANWPQGLRASGQRRHSLRTRAWA